MDIFEIENWIWFLACCMLTANLIVSFHTIREIQEYEASLMKAEKKDV